MKPDAATLDRRAAELRAAFDRSFAAAAAQAAPSEAFLAIDVAGDPYALRLAEIAGLHADKAVTALPGSPPDLLGVAGFRGVLVPVYDLRALLGYAAGPPARWLAVARGKARVGLAFDRFDGHFAVSPDAVVQGGQPVPSRPGLDGTLQEGGRPRHVIGLGALIESIGRRVQKNTIQKER